MAAKSYNLLILLCQYIAKEVFYLRPIIGITMGDPAGIGPEITVKALAQKEIYDICIPVVIGEVSVLESVVEYTGLRFKIDRVTSPELCGGSFGRIDCLVPHVMSESYEIGKVSAVCGEAAFRYITAAINLAMEHRIAAVVTGPINKEAINLAGHHFAGHTEIFAHYTGAKPGSFAMMLASGKLRVIHATTHVSMRQACDMITKTRVLDTIRLAWKAADLMGIEDPVIGVAGLNAHASENGMFGAEENDFIIPAIEHACGEGINAKGPIPPDTVFVRALGGEFDIVVAMYHDQGHIPLKLHGFRMDSETGNFTAVSGINTTIGLPIIRTSVDHGTAFDRAGKNVANSESMSDAIKAAVQMAKRTGEAKCTG